MNSSQLVPTNYPSYQYQVISRHMIYDNIRHSNRFQAGVGLPSRIGVNENINIIAVHPRLAQSQGVAWQHSTGLPAGTRYCLRRFGPSQDVGRVSTMVRRLLDVAFYLNLICIYWRTRTACWNRLLSMKKRKATDSVWFQNHNQSWPSSPLLVLFEALWGLWYLRVVCQGCIQCRI